MAVEIPEGVTAQTVTYSEGAITSTDVTATTLPAGSAVLLKGTASATVNFTISSSDSETSNGSLKGQLATALPSDSYDYTLQTIDTEAFFSGADTLQGFSAYLLIESGLNAYALATTNYVTDNPAVGTLYYVRTSNGYAYATETGLSYGTEASGNNYMFALVNPVGDTDSTLLYNLGQNAYFALNFVPGNNAIKAYTLSDDEAPELYPFTISDGTNKVEGIVLQTTGTSSTLPSVYPVTIGALGMSTLALPVATLVPDGITAVYTAVATTDTTVTITNQMSEDEDGSYSLPTVGSGREVGDDTGANGVIIAGADSSYYFPAITTGATAVSTSGNLLYGVTESSTLEKGKGYLLINNGSAPAFRVSGGVTVPAYKAYLNKAYSTSSTLSISFGGNDGLTGIGTVDAATAGEDGVYYDLQGRRVLNPVKGGIYIIDGKKVIK